MTDYTIFEEALRDFELAVQNKLGVTTSLVQEFHAGSALAMIRGRLIMEESNETDEALDSGTKAELSKELVDLFYVTVGSMVRFGIPLTECFLEVHANNMAKVKNGVVDAKGKLVKDKAHPKVDLSFIVGDA